VADDEGKPAVGDVLRVPDSLTGWSDDPGKHRWCMVVADLGFSVRALPRSASGGQGVFVPEAAMERFSEDGHFYDDPKSLPLSSLRGCDNIGQLPEPYRGQVLELARQRKRRRAQRRQR
jgi:hypothetical protein